MVYKCLISAAQPPEFIPELLRPAGADCIKIAFMNNVMPEYNN
jgi:hypothetical protein